MSTHRLESSAHVLIEGLKLWDLKLPHFTVDLLVKAHKFVVAREDLCAVPFCEFGKSLEQAKLFRMPFDICLIEMITTAAHEFMLTQQFVGEGWQMASETQQSELHERQKSDVQLVVHTFTIHGGQVGATPGVFFMDLSGAPPGSTSSYHQILRSKEYNENPKLMTLLNGFLLTFVALINSRSTRVTEHVPPAKLNKARLVRRKTPLFSCTVLELPSISMTGHSADGTHPHGSPRLHWRRGHLRCLADRIVPVAPCLVGCLEKGAVAHLYEARKHGQLTPLAIK